MSNYLIQSTFGEQNNFEVVVPLATGGLAHFFRDNDNPNMPWNGPNIFGTEFVFCGAALIQSNYDDPDNFEVVAVSNDGHLWHFWRQPDFQWRRIPNPIAAGVTGTPSLIQSTFGEQDNFEVVVPLATGGLAHFFRDNDNPNMPWNGPNIFGTEIGMFSAVSLIQSNYDDPDNFEVVAVNGNRLWHFWRQPDFQWRRTPNPIAAGVMGTPSLIQSTFGEQDNFEVVVPLATGGLAHFFRDNDNPNMPWIPAGRIGVSVNDGEFNGAALIQSNYDDPGNFEVVAVTRNGQLLHYWRQKDFQWKRTPDPIAAGVNIATPHVNIHVFMTPGANRNNPRSTIDRVQEQKRVALENRPLFKHINFININMRIN
ncbi:hypothetical protein M3699_25145 [Peribacillus simplex]|uniref:hypothetical protein n=1 Tax=Peribacillus simplex TaxID=1478 RepID=UPI00203FCCDD|nr:hypothetical protein [Peribacillus simplex]MCM3677017.1 hypothetical protein [Peribacillus simplex]